MQKIRYLPLFLLLLFSVAGLSCRSASDRTEEGLARDTSGLSAEQQDKKALELFKKAYEILGDSSRKEAVPKLEALYREIIDNYPKAVLTQECYWRLILIYLNDYSPSAYDKVESAYNAFIVRYPASQFRGEVEDAISQNYFHNGRWDAIIKLYTPAVRNYIKTGKLSRPQEMFMFAEAKLKLGDAAEAEKGYKIVIGLFPNSRQGSVSKLRLEDIGKLKNK